LGGVIVMGIPLTAFGAWTVAAMFAFLLVNFFLNRRTVKTP
jgi:uncharacterized membrane protein